MRQLDQGMKRWIYSKAHAEHWRVSKLMDLDDLRSEGLMCFAKVLANYPTATEPKHIMALLMTVFSNRIHDLAEKNSRVPDFSPLEDDDEAAPAVMPDTSDALAMMPASLKSAMNHLALDRHALVTFLWIAGGWETANEKLCRISSVKPDEVPLADQVRAYLRDAVLERRMI